MNYGIDFETGQANAFISKLFHARIQTHIFHLQVQGEGSYAAHKALDDFYNDIVDITDELVETYQGKYGIIYDYALAPMENFKSVDNCVQYLSSLHAYIDEKKSSIFKDSDLLNIIDEAKSLIKSTLYKMRFLE